MNKLYVVRFMYGEFNLSTRNFWNLHEAIQTMQEYSDVKFTEIENNDIHRIWEGDIRK